MQFFTHKFNRIREKVAEGEFNSARKRAQDVLREGLAMKSSMACLVEKTATLQHNLVVLVDSLKKAEETSDTKEREDNVKQAMSILNSFPQQLNNIRLAARRLSEQEKQAENKI